VLIIIVIIINQISIFIRHKGKCTNKQRKNYKLKLINSMPSDKL